MGETHRITVDPNQCGGRPCHRGLRIRVKDVLDLLAAGAEREEILADYPLQLPPALARRLAAQGHQAEHVADVGMASSPDSAIWDRALAPNAAIITKDEDFALIEVT